MQICHPLHVVRSISTILLAIVATAVIASPASRAVAARDRVTGRDPPIRLKPSRHPRLDFSGRKRVGIASFYADWFAGRRMADGVRMNPRGDNAASRSLPLGTIAKVTNLRTHESAVVSIQDRGPYIRGRIVDLSPSTARKIGITPRIGIAKVRVTPIAIPLRNGRMRLSDPPKPEHHRPPRHRDGYRVALRGASG
ncbi:MAG TPA: septal ring lytic transglycosylase RlpA family protein [Steroidobacteraceae bacterium]|nr:septal ring lytic transglycosylase RlpA family protein [Steroidobacteraceae bacterium]